MKNKIKKIIIAMDIKAFFIVKRFLLKRVDKTKKHKFRVFHDWLVFEAQFMFYVGFLLPMIFDPNRFKIANLIASFLFLLVLVFTHIKIFKDNAPEIKRYDKIWVKREEEDIQDRELSFCIYSFVELVNIRVKALLLFLLTLSFYNLFSLLAILITLGSFSLFPLVIAMNFYFFNFLVFIYIDTVYDLGKTGKRSKEKKDSKLTKLQEKMWGRLIGSLKPKSTSANL